MTLDSGNVRFVWLFPGVPWRGGIKRQWGNQNVDFGRYVFSTLGNEANIIIHSIM